MRKILPYALLALAPGSASGSEYTYEATVDFTRTNIESSGVFTAPGLPPDTFSEDLSINRLSLGGSWFFNGLSDDQGPRAQAVFVDRASLLSLGYSDVSGDTVGEEGVSLSGRYVWKDSGWFVRGAYVDIDSGGSVDGSVVTAAVGKYIAETTTLDLSYSRQEVDFGSPFFGNVTNTSNAATLSFKHLGVLSSDWQYAVAVSAGSMAFRNADGSYNATFSLYPNRDISLDLGVTGGIGDGSGGASFTLGAGWFFTPRLQGRLSLGLPDDGGNTQTAFGEIDTDITEVGASIRYRF